MKHGLTGAVLALGLALPFAVALAGNAPAPSKPSVDDDDANAPYKVYDATPAITMGPLLLDMADDSVVVEWMTDAPSDAKGS